MKQKLTFDGCSDIKQEAKTKTAIPHNETKLYTSFNSLAK